MKERETALQRHIPFGTYELQSAVLLGRQNRGDWVQWAEEAIVAGFDSASLGILAGLDKPYDDFEVNRLLRKIFNDLKIIWLNDKDCVPYYVCSVIQKWKRGKITLRGALENLKDLCLDRNYDKQLMEFARLYWAQTDLDFSEVQWYWEGADQKNISKIIDDYFCNWLENHKAIAQNLR